MLRWAWLVVGMVEHPLRGTRPRQISSVLLIISVAFWVDKRPLSGAYLGLIQLFLKHIFLEQLTGRKKGLNAMLVWGRVHPCSFTLFVPNKFQITSAFLPQPRHLRTALKVSNNVWTT